MSKCDHEYQTRYDRETMEEVLMCSKCGHETTPETDSGVNPKDLIGRTKPSLGNVPPGPLYEVALAFDDGAAKYGAVNWRVKKIQAAVCLNAAKRHLDCWFHGRDRADDSGVHHLAHAIAGLMILLDAEQQGTMVDNRPLHNVPLDEILTNIAAQRKALQETQK